LKASLSNYHDQDPGLGFGDSSDIHRDPDALDPYSATLHNNWFDDRLLETWDTFPTTPDPPKPAGHRTQEVDLVLRTIM